MGEMHPFWSGFLWQCSKSNPQYLNDEVQRAEEDQVHERIRLEQGRSLRRYIDTRRFVLDSGCTETQLPPSRTMCLRMVSLDCS